MIQHSVWEVSDSSPSMNRVYDKSFYRRLFACKHAAQVSQSEQTSLNIL